MSANNKNNHYYIIEELWSRNYVLLQSGHVCDKRLEFLRTNFKSSICASLSPWTKGKSIWSKPKGMKAGNAKLSGIEVSQSRHVFLWQVYSKRNLAPLLLFCLIKFCRYPLLLYSPQNLRMCGEGVVITTSVWSSVFNNVLLIIPFLRFAGFDAQVPKLWFYGVICLWVQLFFFPVSCLWYWRIPKAGLCSKCLA